MRITGLERANADELKRTLGVRAGENIDFKKINMGISRAFGTGYFERINYSLLNDGGFNVLTVDAREKQWGPNYLRFGLTLSADTQGEGRFNLLMRYLQTQVNSYGAEWSNDFQLGRDRRFASQFFQPFGATGLLNAFSISPGIEFSKRPLDFYASGQRITQFLLSTNASTLDIGYDLTRNSILRLGAIKSNNTSTLNIGVSQLPEFRFKEGGMRFKLLYDSLDDANFPKEGRTFQLDYYASLDSLGADTQYRKAEVNYRDNVSFGSNTFSLVGRYGRALQGRLSTYNQYSLGGFLNLSAYRPGELLGQAVAFGRLSYYRRLGQFSNPFGRSMYAGLSAEFAHISDFPNQIWKTETRNSFAAYVGIDTLIGPLYLGYGRARQRSSVFYLFLGQP